MSTRDRAFTVRDALAAGYTERSLRRDPDLRAPVRGVRVRGSNGDARTDMFDALDLLLAPDQFFASITAARVHGMPLPARFNHDQRVHVASPTKRARMDRAGSVGHRFKSQTVVVAGHRVETVADTWVHLAMELSVDELIAVGDWIVLPRRPGVLNLEHLVENAKRFKGATFMPVVGAALPHIRVGAESPRESDTRMLLVRGGLPEPVVQHVVRDAFGNTIRLDLAWPDIKLAVEYDGQHHFSDPDQATSDMRRHRALQLEGWMVIRVANEDFADGGRRILEIIVAEYAKRRLALAA